MTFFFFFAGVQMAETGPGREYREAFKGFVTFFFFFGLVKVAQWVHRGGLQGFAGEQRASQVWKLEVNGRKRGFQCVRKSAEGFAGLETRD